MAKFIIKSKDSLRTLYRFSGESDTPCLKNVHYCIQALIYKKKKANRKSQAAFQKAAKEWERKHPVQALKQRIKRLFW